MANRITMGPIAFFALALGFMGTIGVSYWMGQQNNKPDALTEYNTKFDAYQDTVVKPILAKADSLDKAAKLAQSIAEEATKKAEVQTKTIVKLQNTVAVLRTTNKQLSDSVLADTSTPPECDQCKRALVAVNHEVDSLNQLVAEQEKRDTTRLTTITNLNTALLFSNTRGDSLQKVIINFPAPPKPNRFLGVTLPRIPSQYVIMGAIGTGILIAR